MFEFNNKEKINTISEVLIANLEKQISSENTSAGLAAYESPSGKPIRTITRQWLEKSTTKVNGEVVEDKRSADLEVDSNEDTKEVEIKTKSKLRSLVLTIARRLNKYRPGLVISVDYKDQQYEYKLKRPLGFWPEYPDFEPDLTPEEMLCAGIYEGWLFRDCYVEFPREWYLKALDLDKIAILRPMKRYNKFNIYASDYVLNWKEEDSETKDKEDLSELTKHDPRGFAQWYFRFYIGRRIPTVDRVRIRRWIQFKKKFLPLIKSCDKDDLNCKPRLRQAMLCWGIDLKE